MPHRLRRALAAAAILLLTGCTTAPLVQPAGDAGPSLLADIPDARPVEIETDDGVTLRGAWLDAGPDAPLVLHLLPSAASTTTGVPIGVGRVGLAHTIRSLHDLGYASLVFDYRGLGDSGGRRTAAHLLSDGRAMWRHAVALADSHEDRVVIRAGSLGALIAADLLEQGHTPRAVVLFAPVRADTITHNAARARAGTLRAWIADLLHKAPDAPPLEDAIAHTAAPTLVILPESDEYLTPSEREIVRTAALDAGHTVATHDGDHHTCIARSWGFEIRGFSGNLTPQLTDTELQFLNALPTLQSR